MASTSVVERDGIAAAHEYEPAAVSFFLGSTDFESNFIGEAERLRYDYWPTQLDGGILTESEVAQ
jgi:hypothetical protein